MGFWQVVAAVLLLVGGVLLRAPFVGLRRHESLSDPEPYARERMMLLGFVLLITGAGIFVGTS